MAKPEPETIHTDADDEYQDPVRESSSNVTHLQHPGTPTTVDELSRLKDLGVKIIETRGEILRKARILSIQMTQPMDWLLFRADHGIFGYLQDSGCDRINNLWGITVRPTSEFTEESDPNTQEFMFSIEGEGWSTLTGEHIEKIEGSRMSTEDFVKDVHSPLKKRQYVKKAARANLTGSITRRLAGMRSAPLREILAAKGMDEPTFLAQAALGKGFGTKSERQGLGVTAGEIPPDFQPDCGVCGKRMSYRAGGKTQQGRTYPAFWGCADYKKADHKKADKALHSMTHDDAVKRWKEMAANEAQDAPGADDGDNGGERDPGQEG